LNKFIFHFFSKLFSKILKNYFPLFLDNNVKNNIIINNRISWPLIFFDGIAYERK
jgi:hypothetical protein